MKKVKFLITGAVLVAVIIAGVLFAHMRNPKPIHFNRLGSVTEGAPKWNPNAYNEDIEADEINSMLGIDISSCIPENLKDYWIYGTAEYIDKNVLGSITLGILAPNNKPYFGKMFYVSVANKQWSDESHVFVDWSYDGKQKSSTIHGVTVNAFIREPTVLQNPKTGFSLEQKAVYIASFTINGYEYYIEGREGITEDEFTDFVICVIEKYVS